MTPDSRALWPMTAAVRLCDRLGALFDYRADADGWRARATIDDRDIVVAGQASPSAAVDAVIRDLLDLRPCPVCRTTIICLRRTDLGWLAHGPNTEPACVWLRHRDEWLPGCVDHSAERGRLHWHPDEPPAVLPVHDRRIAWIRPIAVAAGKLLDACDGDTPEARRVLDSVIAEAGGA